MAGGVILIYEAESDDLSAEVFEQPSHKGDQPVCLNG
jgi:hypothetical protein